MIRFIVNGEKYEDCLKPRYPDKLIAIKRGSIPLNKAKEIREEIKLWSDDFLAEWKPKLIINSVFPDLTVNNLLDDVTYSCFRKAFNQ